MNEAELWQTINNIVKDLVQLQQAVKELSQKINEKDGLKNE